MADMFQPDPSRVCGVDTDFYLGYWDPQKARQNGVQFAFIRACQNIWPDREFAHSWSASKGVMPRGAYIYMTKQISNDGQARQFASMFPNNTYDGELPIVVDLEEEKVGAQLYVSDMDAFLLALPKYLKGWDRKYIIYTGYSWWKDFGSTNAKYADVPLWIANPPPYTHPSQQFYPTLLAPFKRVVFDQTSFAGDGILYGGTSKGIDLDYYLGTLEQFKTEFGIGELPPVVVPPVVIPPISQGGNVKGTVKAGMITNIKSKSSGIVQAVMKAGDYVYGELSSQGTDLINFTHYYKAGINVELGILCKATVQNMTLTNEAEPSVTPPPPPVGVIKTHQIDVMSDGSILVDGKLL